MEKQKIEQVKNPDPPGVLVPNQPPAKVPRMGKSPSELGHRLLAGHLVRSLQTWGYFRPHVYLMKEEQDVRYANTPERFKSALHFGVNYQVVEPIPTKAELMGCLRGQIYWQRDKLFDDVLGLEGGYLRDEWLQELAHRLG